MELCIKALIGAVIVIMIQLLSSTKNYYIAGLLPLFPTFALIAHYIVGTERTVADLKTTINFGTWALLPYFIYLRALYLLIDRYSLVASLCIALFFWLMATTILLLVVK